MDLCFQDVAFCEDDEESMVQQLLQCEEEFVSQMVRGITRYSRPLRHAIISPQEHQTLFRNVEKVGLHFVLHE